MVLSPTTTTTTTTRSSLSPSAIAKSKISAEVPNAYSVKEGILARQKRIQELFSGRSTVDSSLPQVGKFTKAELERQQQQEPSHNLRHRVQKPQKQQEQQHEEDLTEECTENLDDSASWGNAVVVVDAASPKPKPQPEPWGENSHTNQEEQKKEEQESCHEQQVDGQALRERQFRKQVHEELIRTYKECVKIQEEDAQKRNEKYGKNVAILTEAPLDERAEKRKLRLQQAKERIRREQEQEALNKLHRLSKYTIVEQRQKVYDTYLYLGMPPKKKFQQRAAAGTFSISPQDVHLLPWLDGDLTVDVAALTRLQRREELASENIQDS